MEKAINDWFKKEGDTVDNNGENVEDMHVYTDLIGIPYDSLYRYIHPNKEKQKILGNGERGQHKLMGNDNNQFIGETLARFDRYNDGTSKKEATYIVTSTVPNLTRLQASMQLSRRVIAEAHSVGIRKKTVQKVKATTSDRITITSEA